MRPGMQPGMQPGTQPGMQPSGMAGQVCSQSFFISTLVYIHLTLLMTSVKSPLVKLSLNICVCLQPGFLNAQMMAQRSREMMTMQMRRQRMMMLMQQQQQQQVQSAAGGFSPPPNVTAPGGMDSPMRASPMNQPGQQGFNYGGNYGKLTGTELFVSVIFLLDLSHTFN